MEAIQFLSEASQIAQKELVALTPQLEEEIRRMHQAVLNGYDDVRASINLVSDTTMLTEVKKIVAEKRKLDPACIIVVGIGGSNLGTIAVQEAVLGKLYNQRDTSIQMLYADTVDADLIHDIITCVKPVLARGKHIILNGVSKSGGTTETIAIFEVLVDLIKEYTPDYAQYIVVTTDKESKFWHFAHEQGFTVLEIPKKVGGRFSVFSPVGLFPLGVCGIDIDLLLAGARVMRDRCLLPSLIENPAAHSAGLMYLHHKKGITIHDLFLFSTDLESLGKWYRQLMGESIGKEFDKNQKQVFEGITPTVSIGSTDLHSMAQLYLGGPYDKFTTFVRVKQNRNQMFIPDEPAYNTLVEGIQRTDMQVIMDAILDGVQIAFTKGHRPFTEIVLPDKSAYSIGQLLQFKMMEMMYLGFLLGVNPFDQPNVEAYKVETRALLMHEAHM
jgi:glucose-6-phosphate isomerase